MQKTFQFIQADASRAALLPKVNAHGGEIRDVKAKLFQRMIREIKVLTVMEQPATGDKTDAPEVAAQFWRDHVEHAPWYDAQKEHMIALLLDARYKVTSFALISLGTLNESLAHPREIFRPAIVAGAYALIVMHNHPSGEFAIGFRVACP